jgi:hypothetical protein
MKKTFVALGVILIIGLWVYLDSRSDYTWAQRIIDKEYSDGWALAARNNNFVDPFHPWTLFNAPVTGLWFVRPNEIQSTGTSDVVVLDVLRVSYDYSRTERESYVEYINIKNGTSAYLSSKPNAKAVVQLDLTWTRFPVGTPGDDLIKFVQALPQFAGGNVGPTTVTTPDSFASSELGPHYVGDEYHYVGEYYRNFVYLHRGEKGTFLSGTETHCSVDIFSVRERFGVLLHDPKSGGFISVDGSEIQNVKDEDLHFENAAPGSMAALAWSKASDPDKFAKDVRVGKHMRWIFVDALFPKDLISAEVFIGLPIEKSKAFEGCPILTLEKERSSVNIDGKSNKFTRHLMDILALPIGDTTEHILQPGDLPSEIWRLHISGIVK